MTYDTIRIIEDARMLSDSEWKEMKKELLKKAECSTIEKKIYNILIELGISPSVKGYNYIKRAIMLSLEDPTILDRITGRLYPALAKEFGGCWQRVEMIIRSSIETAFRRGNMEKIQEIFGYAYSSEKGKTTNSEFIAGITEYIRNT